MYNIVVMFWQINRFFKRAGRQAYRFTCLICFDCGEVFKNIEVNFILQMMYLFCFIQMAHALYMECGEGK